MSINRIVTYSLLAHINDSTEGIKDLSEIFIPLVKDILTDFAIKDHHGGQLIELQQAINQKFKLSIPFPLLKVFLNKVAAIVNTNEKTSLQVNKDGSFILKDYTFHDYDDCIKEQESEVEMLKNEYDSFLRRNGLDPSSQASLFNFLDNNRKALSSFFNKKTFDSSVLTGKYIEQMRFIEEIKSSIQLYRTLKKVYLGSVITCYLECDNSSESTMPIEFLFDTTFIISLLNLRTPEDKQTCDTILEICSKLKHNAVIMNITLQETSNLLLTRADSLGSINAPNTLSDSVYSSCARNGLTKTDLQQIANNLPNELKKIFGSKNYDFSILKISERDLIRVKNSDIYKSIKDRENNKDGALHDAVAFDTIRNKRNKNNFGLKSNFYSAGYWFVTHDRNTGALLESFKNHITECISPDYLVNILWLCNPSINTLDLKDIGLTKLISNTIDNSLSKSRVFLDLNNNIKKYSEDGVSNDQYVYLASAVARNSLSILDIQEINNEADNENFIPLVHEKVRKAKEIDELERIKREAVEKEKAELEHKYREEIELFNKQHQEQLKKEQQEGSRKHTYSIIKLTLEKNNIQIAQLKDKINYLIIEKSRIEKKARKDVYMRVIPIYLLIGVVISFICFYLYANYIKPYWSTIEPALIFSGVLVGYCIGGFKAFLGKDFSPKAYLAKLVNLRQNALNKTYNIDNNEISVANETYNYLFEENKVLNQIQETILNSTKSIDELFEEISACQNIIDVKSLLGRILAEIERNTI